MKQMRIFFGVLIVAVSFYSCDPNRLSDQNFEIENESWSKDQAITFDLQIEDTTLHYNIYVNIRNSSEYAYSNIYLFIEMTSPTNKFFKDTVEFKLADPSGKWIGSGIGNIWQNQIPLLQKVKLLEPGTYQIKIYQGMREDVLNAITDVGIRVEKVYE